jgi:hypothetical protein
MRRLVGAGAGGLAGVVVGAAITLGLQGPAAPGPPAAREASPRISLSRPAAPATFLAWVPHGLPDGFARKVDRLPQVGDLTVVAEDNVWLTRSWSATGDLVDEAPEPYRIPLDAAAIDVETFAPFLPPGERTTLAALDAGEGVLGSSSASLRGLGPGAVLAFGRVRVRIAAVLPDELVGAAELVVGTETGRRMGVAHARHLLLRPAEGWRTSSPRLERLLEPLLPADHVVQVRAPGETPFFRAGDAVLPPVLLKTLFGEFAARRAHGHPGTLEVDPAWTREHLVRTRVPILGVVTCHRGIIDQLRGAMRDLRDRGFAHLIRSFHGCWVPKFVTRDPTALPSHHTWGIAFDVNLVGNYYGQEPHQDERLVATLAAWGFQWGGEFIIPDGNHFEYKRAPA